MRTKGAEPGKVLSPFSFFRRMHLGVSFALDDATYTSIFEKGLAELGRTYAIGPIIEIYKNDPENTTPDELISEVYVPLKP